MTLDGSGRAGKLALVLAADEAFAEGTAVALHSALEHLSHGAQPDVYVLDNGVARESRERLSEIASAVSGRDLRWIPLPSGRLLDHPKPNLTSTSYCRLLIPELLPETVQRAVYLDVDILVRQDLSPLFGVGLGGAPLGAVRDAYVQSTDARTSGIRGLVEGRPYFNAGVLVMDLARWRDERLAERVLEFARSSTVGDQDAMNAVVSDWYELEPRWNVQLTMYWEDAPSTDRVSSFGRTRDELYRDAAVVHFAGFPKPWHPWARGPSPGALLWARALMRSGWYTPMESLRWLLPWLGRRVVDRGRRARSARGGEATV